ncbi:hypothetical protein MA16_Dca026588 [Dendrobium catenatum]|uniref:Uncharacterized protein n=1 Tax=Dendrobium catenatum TaxID=906689 RepID=A0A2I0X1L6_9ASPA|nr:hypothetical protein MA16_Dca026588 [Dendrobium catenatum]
MDIWVPTEGSSTDSLQNELYKLQMKLHMSTENYVKKKKRLQEQFKEEREEILKRYEAKIQELDALPSSPRNKSKATSSGDELLQPEEN